jgi:uncharacterized membrane protein YqjE
MFAGAIESAVMNRLSGSASVLADHASAYADIIIADVEAVAHSAARRLWAATVLVIAASFTFAIGCTWLVAATWDTTAHLPVMIGLIVAGVVVAVGAWQALSRYRLTAPQPMSMTLAEWAKDRQLLKDLIRANESHDS